MRTMKNNILGIGFAALFFLSFGAPALGAETAVASSPVPAAEAKSVKCDLDVRAKALTDFIGQEAEDTEKKAEQELVLRQELLQSVLACAEEEAGKLHASVEGAKLTDDIVFRKAAVLKGLENARNFYRAQLEKAGTGTLAENKNLAKELKDWRAKTYQPLSEEAGSLVLWGENRELLNVAETRYKQIGQTIRMLKLIEQENIRNRYAESERNLRRAGELNEQARLALRRSAATEDTMQLERAALDALSATYKSFLDLSEEVKKYLPI